MNMMLYACLIWYGVTLTSMKMLVLKAKVLKMSGFVTHVASAPLCPPSNQTMRLIVSITVELSLSGTKNSMILKLDEEWQ